MRAFGDVQRRPGATYKDLRFGSVTFSVSNLHLKVQWQFGALPGQICRSPDATAFLAKLRVFGASTFRLTTLAQAILA
jgi:hypothetical protein